MHAYYHACMAQLTIRTDDRLVEQVRRAAAARSQSMNEFVAHVLDVATNPESATTADDRIRERLAAAGLLAPTTPRPASSRPPRDAVRRARKRAGAGTPLADLVSSGRGSKRS